MNTIKKLFVVIAVLSIPTFFVSCPSTREAARAAKDLPEWYLNPRVAEDAIYGVGSAKMSTLDMSRTVAVSRARDDVARQVTVAVQNAIIDYAQEAGADGEAQTIQFTETISKQIANVSLKGCRTEEIIQGKDGTVFALVAYPIDQLNEESYSKFQRNEAAAWAEFKAREAERWLNDELEKNPPQSGQSR
jgi:hypothetical protein